VSDGVVETLSGRGDMVSGRDSSRGVDRPAAFGDTGACVLVKAHAKPLLKA
jgi:hypothetical protein